MLLQCTSARRTQLKFAQVRILTSGISPLFAGRVSLDDWSLGLTKILVTEAYYRNQGCTPRRLFAGASSWSCGSIARLTIINHGKGWQGYRIFRCVLMTCLIPHSRAVFSLSDAKALCDVVGKRRNKTHTLCRRCGRRSFHIQKSTCSSCGYPAARIRKCKGSIATVPLTAEQYFGLDGFLELDTMPYRA